MTIDTLRQVPLFESLDNEAAGELCHLLESLDCKASTILFRAGDEGDAMYVIERGKVRICVRTTQGHELTLTELGRGDFFGEMALLGDGQRRSADAVVAEDARLAVLFFNVWVLINTLLLANSGFDPYPYLLLSTGINMLAVLQAPIILMSQNRQAHKDRLRSEIDYQINLKNELALNEILERLKTLEREYLQLTSDKRPEE